MDDEEPSKEDSGAARSGASVVARPPVSEHAHPVVARIDGGPARRVSCNLASQVAGHHATLECLNRHSPGRIERNRDFSPTTADDTIPTGSFKCDSLFNHKAPVPTFAS